MDGERWVSYRPLAADEAPQAGETALRFAVVEMPCSSFYNGTTYVDTMNREATETFLQMTHQRYVEECGARIGDSILGIFTDEPHRGALMTSFGQGVDAGERQNHRENLHRGVDYVPEPSRRGADGGIMAQTRPQQPLLRPAARSGARPHDPPRRHGFLPHRALRGV